MFDNYQYSEGGTPEVPLSFSYNSIEEVINMLRHVDDYSDRDLYELVKKTYSMILDEIFTIKNVDLIRMLYNTPKFITALTAVLGEVELNQIQFIWCNKLTYDYFTSTAEKNSYVKALLLQLSSTVNRRYTPGLIGLGLNENLVSYLVNARFSTEKEDIQVKRLNLILMNQSPDIMTLQMIVDIYGKLFDRITPLFSGIMYDYWEPESLMNDSIAEVYATITMAIITIVNNLPQDLCLQLLKSFAESHCIVNIGKSVRFNIYAIVEEDFPRLYLCLKILKANNIVLPS